MIGFRSMYGVFVSNTSARSAFAAALSALSFSCIVMCLDIQVKIMLLSLERRFILSRSLVMREVDLFLFGGAWRSDLVSE